MNCTLRLLAFVALFVAAVVDGFMTAYAVFNLMRAGEAANINFVGGAAFALALVVAAFILLTRQIIFGEETLLRIAIFPWGLALLVDAGTNYITLYENVGGNNLVTDALIMLASIALVGAPIIVSLGYDWFMCRKK